MGKQALRAWPSGFVKRKENSIRIGGILFREGGRVSYSIKKKSKNATWLGAPILLTGNSTDTNVQ